MSWITIVWSMNAAACLTLAGIYLLVWCKQREGWVYLVFSCSAVAAAARIGAGDQTQRPRLAKASVALGQAARDPDAQPEAREEAHLEIAGVRVRSAEGAEPAAEPRVEQAAPPSGLPRAAWIAAAAFALAFVVTRAAAADCPYQPTLESLDRHPVPEWYQDAKFGIFIHWAVFSVPAYASPTFFPLTALAEWYWKLQQTRRRLTIRGIPSFETSQAPTRARSRGSTRWARSPA